MTWCAGCSSRRRVSLLAAARRGPWLWQEGPAAAAALHRGKPGRVPLRAAVPGPVLHQHVLPGRHPCHHHRTVDELHRQAHFLQAPGQGELLTQFYVIALAGVVESWVLGELKCSAEELVDFIDQLLTDQLRGAIDRQKEESLRLNRPQGGLAT